jgi:predicted amidohydrolase YtcJ
MVEESSSIFFLLFLCLIKLLQLFQSLAFEQKISDAKEGSWILGGGWNNDLWGGESPAASWIDDITPSNPVSSDFVYFDF